MKLLDWIADKLGYLSYAKHIKIVGHELRTNDQKWKSIISNPKKLKYWQTVVNKEQELFSTLEKAIWGGAHPSMNFKPKTMEGFRRGINTLNHGDDEL